MDINICSSPKLPNNFGNSLLPEAYFGKYIKEKKQSEFDKLSFRYVILSKSI